MPQEVWIDDTDWKDEKSSTDTEVIGDRLYYGKTSPFFETGEVTLTDTIDGQPATTISFKSTYTDPVVITQQASRNNNTVTVTRSKNAGANSAEIFMEGDDGETGYSETVHYIVMEKGTFEIEGVKFEAGSIDTTNVHREGDELGGVDVDYLNTYESSPVVFSSLQTYNNGEFMDSIVTAVGSTSFRTQQEAAGVGSNSVEETIGYVIIERGLDRTLQGDEIRTGANGGNSTGFEDSPVNFSYTSIDESPHVSAEGRTDNGGDGYFVTPDGSPTQTDFAVYADEDDVGDSERGHTGETFSFGIFSPDTVFQELENGTATWQSTFRTQNSTLDAGKIHVWAFGSFKNEVIDITVKSDIDNNDVSEEEDTVLMDNDRINKAASLSTNPDRLGIQIEFNVTDKTIPYIDAVAIDSRLPGGSNFAWDSENEWDFYQEQIGVSHEDVPNTDHDTPSTLTPGPSYEFPLHPEDLIFYYPMDEDSGTTVNDISTETPDASGITNGVTVGVPGRNNTTAFSFDRSNEDNIPVDYEISSPIRKLTINAWIKPDATNDEQIINAWDRSEYWRFGVENGTLFILLENISNPASGNITVNDGDWHMATVVYDGDISKSVRIYVDGELDSSSTTGGGDLGTGATRYGFIGINSEASTFNGDTFDGGYGGVMDQHQMWLRALTEEEVKMLYEASAGPHTFVSPKKTL